MAVISIVATIAATTLWVIDSVGKWDDWGITAGHDGTIACTFIAAMLWLACASDSFWRSLRAEFRRRESAVIHVADRIGGPPTQPFPRIP
jgi:hypothetical protein